MKYLAICSIWLLAYTMPQFAGEWYEPWFHVWQSAISLFLLYAVFKLSDEWWTREYGCICVIQVVFNMGDLFFGLSTIHYDSILSTLNSIEALIIFGFGGITQAYRMYQHGRDTDRNNPHHGRMSAD